MRARLILFSLFVLISSAAAQVQPGGGINREIFLVENGNRLQWCAYASKSDSEIDRKVLNAMSVASVKYTNGRISAAEVTEWDESGDWNVDDEYTIDGSGTIQALTRTIDNFTEGITQEEKYKIQNGKATKEKSSAKDRRNGQPAEELSSYDFPTLPIITTVRGFEFFPLISDAGRRANSTGKACITVTRPAPTPPPPPVPVKSWSTYIDARFGWSIDYPSTWTAKSTCPVGCPGEAVIFSNSDTKNSVIVDGFTDRLGGSNVDERLQELKRSRNVNPQVSETPIQLGNLKGLTVRYEQPATQMEATYVVTDFAHFEIHFSSDRWKIEQMTDYPAYRHMLESFRFSK